MARTIVSLALACCVMFSSGAIRAGPPPKLARELVDKLMGKFGREIAEEGTEAVAKRLAQMGERFGVDALKVFEHTGPKGLRVLEAAGSDAARLAPILAQHGNEAAWLVALPERAALVLRHGDDASWVLIRHRHVGEVMVRKWGQPAAQALAQLNPQNGRRLAMLLEAGQPLAKPEAKGLLGVVAEHGNLAMDFVWRNKGALAVTAALVAFVNDPKPFLSGGRDLAQVIGHAAVQPLTEAAVEVSREVHWGLVLSVIAGIAGICFYLKHGRIRQPDSASKGS